MVPLALWTKLARCYYGGGPRDPVAEQRMESGVGVKAIFEAVSRDDEKESEVRVVRPRLIPRGAARVRGEGARGGGARGGDEGGAAS